MITATGGSSVNGESRLTFDGATLTVNPTASSTATTLAFGNGDNATIASYYSMVFQVNSSNTQTGRSYAWSKAGTGYGNGSNLMSLTADTNVLYVNGSVNSKAYSAPGNSNAGTYQYGLTNSPTWNVNQGSYTNNNSTAPDGSTTAATYTLTVNSWDLYQTIAVTSGVVYRVGVWVKLGTANNFCIVINNTQAWNTVSGKAFNSSDGLSTSKWTHVSLTFTGPSTGNINLHIGGHSESITQQTAGTVFVWNWEVTTGNSTWISNIDDEVRLPGSSIFTSRGLLGIGTTSPSVKLQVVGENSTEGQLYVGNTDVTYSAGINFTTSGTNRGFVGWRHTNSGSPYSLTGIHLFNTDNSNIVFGTNGAVRAVINLNGHLGIGTTTPSYRLEVVTSGTLAQRLQSSNSTVGNPIIDIYDAGRLQEAVISSTDGTTTGTYIASYSNHPLLFGTNAGASPTAKVRMQADNADTPTSTLKIAPGGLILGGNNSGKEINSAQISAGYHQPSSMNFVGMSTSTGSSDRRMDFWVEGGAFFRGTLTATGDIVAYGSTSDIRLKKNIVPINGALDTIMKVNGYIFQWNEKAPVEKRDKTEYGVIAQEVEAAGLDLLIRDYVRPVNGTDGDNTPPEVWKSVQYDKFVPILIEAIKEQQTQIESQKSQNEELIKRIETLESILQNKGI